MDDYDYHSSIFDHETTISMSAGNIEKILIMQVREDVHRKVEAWLNTTGGTSDHYRAKKRANAGLKLLMAKLDWGMQKKAPNKRGKILSAIDEERYYEALLLLNEYLLEIGLTSFYQKKIDTSNVEEENEAKGL